MMKGFFLLEVPWMLWIQSVYSILSRIYDQLNTAIINSRDYMFKWIWHFLLIWGWIFGYIMLVSSLWYSNAWCLSVIKVHLISCLFVGKNFAGKSSHESESSSFVVAASEKVLVPGSQSDGSSSLKEQFEAADLALEDPLVCAYSCQLL